jgi:hypothetical protein
VPTGLSVRIGVHDPQRHDVPQLEGIS